MPKLKNRLPRLCRDRKLAISWHNGTRIYHGVWGTPDAEKNYKRFIAALIESPVQPPQLDKGSMLVSELADAFLDSIESRISKSEFTLHKYAIGYLAEVYGELAVNEFSPKKLKIVRSQMVKTGTLCRKTINNYIGKIRRMFAWGVEEEVATADISHALKAVKDLRQGEEGTFDHPEREAVPEWVIAATLPFMPPTVAAIVQVQWLTGMRPSEVLNMRVGDIDTMRGNGLWYYSPKTAQRERAAEARANKKSKRTALQRERDAKRSEENAGRVGDFYDHCGYRRAVKYAIEKGQSARGRNSSLVAIPSAQFRRYRY